MTPATEEQFLREFALEMRQIPKGDVDEINQAVKGYAKLLKLREDSVRLDEAEKHLANLRDNRDCITCYSNYCKFRDRVANLKELTTPNNTPNTPEEDQK